MEYQNNGSQFVFTTSRSQKLELVTKKILNDLGFKNYKLVMGLLNSSRILINDFNSNNPHPRAKAINVYRDSDELNRFMWNENCSYYGRSC